MVTDRRKVLVVPHENLTGRAEHQGENYEDTWQVVCWSNLVLRHAAFMYLKLLRSTRLSSGGIR